MPRAAQAPGLSQGLAPVWREDAELLLLGSFPGQASLAARQYYAHPRNAFWPLLGALLDEPDLPKQPYEARLQRLVERRVALWDAVARCVRPGSLDSRIRDAEPSALPDLVARLPRLRAIGCNGGTAFRQACAALPGAPWPFLALPSSSPALASVDFEAKRQAWWALRFFLAPAGHFRQPQRAGPDCAPCPNAAR
ncbi:MAG: DNA-deoxyinosine glycosylase [Burkholderiales bacterium]|nr:DNA-deoxyinosine glycosylase [Burkholderiales bacterium]